MALLPNPGSAPVPTGADKTAKADSLPGTARGKRAPQAPEVSSQAKGTGEPAAQAPESEEPIPGAPVRLADFVPPVPEEGGDEKPRAATAAGPGIHRWPEGEQPATHGPSRDQPWTLALVPCACGGEIFWLSREGAIKCYRCSPPERAEMVEADVTLPGRLTAVCKAVPDVEAG